MDLMLAGKLEDLILSENSELQIEGRAAKTITREEIVEAITAIVNRIDPLTNVQGRFIDYSDMSSYTVVYELAIRDEGRHGFTNIKIVQDLFRFCLVKC